MATTHLSTAAVADLFAEEIEARGGRVTEVIDDRERLFARSTLPGKAELQPGDALQGGVAVKASAAEICIYPYVFRHVCKNGAILAFAFHAERLVLRPDVSSFEAAETLRHAIAACCEEEVFRQSLEDLGSSRHTRVDLALTLAPMIARLPRGHQLIAQIFDRFSHDEDSSRYGLMNAVTSVARDTRDSQLRWNLEELGGGIGAGRIVPVPSDSQGAARDLPKENVLN